MNQTKFTLESGERIQDALVAIANEMGDCDSASDLAEIVTVLDRAEFMLSKAPEMFEALKQALSVLEKSVHFETSLPFWKKGGDGYQAMIETRSLLNSIQDGGGK